MTFHIGFCINRSLPHGIQRAWGFPPFSLLLSALSFAGLVGLCFDPRRVLPNGVDLWCKMTSFALGMTAGG